jgi:hypothetical protein
MTGGVFQAFGWRVVAGLTIQFVKGAGSGSAIFNLGRGKFYEGAGTGTMLFNVSGGKLYRGSGSSDVACNWSGGRLSVTELAAVVWLVEYPY